MTEKNMVKVKSAGVAEYEKRDMLLPLKALGAHLECQRCREQMLIPVGPSRTLIQPGEEVTFSGHGADVFGAKRLMIDAGPEDRLTDLSVVGIWMGVDRQLTQTIDALPARSVVGVDRDYQPLQISQNATVILKNESDTPIVARAWFEGVTVRFVRSIEEKKENA